MPSQNKIITRVQLGLLVFAACAGSVEVEWTGPVGELGCDFDPEVVCPLCTSGTIYVCECVPLNDNAFYAYDENDPCTAGKCPQLCGGQGDYVQISGQCIFDEEEPTPTEGSNYDCGNWEPDELITNPSTNNYGVSGDLVSAVLNDTTPLYACDSARIDVSTGLEVKNAVSTDMAYLLGLRNGDILVEINAMPLGDPMEALMAFHQLYLEQGEDSYTLKVQRGSGYVYLSYGILWVAP